MRTADIPGLPLHHNTGGGGQSRFFLACSSAREIFGPLCPVVPSISFLRLFVLTGTAARDVDHAFGELGGIACGSLSCRHGATERRLVHRPFGDGPYRPPSMRFLTYAGRPSYVTTAGVSYSYTRTHTHRHERRLNTEFLVHGEEGVVNHVAVVARKRGDDRIGSPQARMHDHAQRLLVLRGGRIKRAEQREGDREQDLTNGVSYDASGARCYCKPRA